MTGSLSPCRIKTFDSPPDSGLAEGDGDTRVIFDQKSPGVMAILRDPHSPIGDNFRGLLPVAESQGWVGDEIETVLRGSNSQCLGQFSRAGAEIPQLVCLSSLLHLLDSRNGFEGAKENESRF